MESVALFIASISMASDRIPKVGRDTVYPLVNIAKRLWYGWPIEIHGFTVLKHGDF